MKTKTIVSILVAVALVSAFIVGGVVYYAYNKQQGEQALTEVKAQTLKETEVARTALVEKFAPLAPAPIAPGKATIVFEYVRESSMLFPVLVSKDDNGRPVVTPENIQMPFWHRGRLPEGVDSNGTFEPPTGVAPPRYKMEQVRISEIPSNPRYSALVRKMQEGHSVFFAIKGVSPEQALELAQTGFVYFAGKAPAIAQSTTDSDYGPNDSVEPQ